MKKISTKLTYKVFFLTLCSVLILISATAHLFAEDNPVIIQWDASQVESATQNNNSQTTAGQNNTTVTSPTGAVIPENISETSQPSASDNPPSNSNANQGTNAPVANSVQVPENGDGFWAPLLRAIGDLGGVIITGFGAAVLNSLATIQLLGIVPLVGALMRLAAYFLEAAATHTLSINTEGINTAVQTVWTLVRNIFNVTFIFILLYTSIKTIIGSSSSNTKKTIADVITAALLINFSLFFTKIFIDAGNILAAQLYNLATANGTVAIGDSIMTWANISGLLNVESLGMLIKSPLDPAFFIVVSLQTAMLWVAIFVFFYVALMFFARNVVLIFLMVLSPIGFMGNVLPKISEYTKMWKENLFGQISIAPVFFLFFYLISLVQTVLSNTPKELQMTRDNLEYTTYFKYIMIIIMLITAVKMTKKLSGEVGKFVVSIGNAALTIAAAAVTGGAATLAARGGALATRGASMIATGRSIAATDPRRAAQLVTAGQYMMQRGRTRQSIGNLVSGETVGNIMQQPGVVGRTLRAGKDSLFKNTKKEIGVDLKEILGARSKYEKEDEKLMIEKANRIGGDKEKKELDTLEKINANIESQAKKKIEDDHKTDMERIRSMPRKSELEKEAYRTAMENLNSTMKAEAQALAPVIAQKTGVNLDENRSQIQGLKLIIEEKSGARDKYVTSLGSSLAQSKKKVAQILRTSQNVKPTDKPQETLEKLLKELGFEKPKSSKETTEEKPKEEKKTT